MSILSVDTIQPIGSGTTITLNAAKIVVGTGITFESNGQATYAGIITATSFSGSGANLTSLPSQATISNNADNRVITGGSGTNLNGEASLQFDGYRLGIGGAPNNIALDITKNQQGGLRITDTSVSNASFEIRPQTGNSTKMFRIIDVSANSDRFNITSGGKTIVKGVDDQDNFVVDVANTQFAVHTDGTDGEISLRAQDGSGSNNAKYMTFFTHPSGSAAEERLRINSAGNMGLGTGANIDEKVHFENAGNISLLVECNTSGNGSNSAIRLKSADSSSDWYMQTGNAVSGGLRFYSGSERLRISSAGYVTKPNHPSFIAGRTGGNQTFTVGTYPLNVARLNVGNHYNTSTYKFVVPVAGVYYFYGQVYYNNGAGQYRLHIRKTPNGGSAFQLNTSSHKIDAGHPSGGNDTSDSLSIIESMAVGDTVELYSDQNHSIQCYYNINDATYGAHTYFMGYLIG